MTNTAIIHYHRRNADYLGWGLHLWGPGITPLLWEEPALPTGQDAFGLFWNIGLPAGTKFFHFLIYKGNEKDPGSDQTLVLKKRKKNQPVEIWLIQGREPQFSNPETALEAMEIHLRTAPSPSEQQVILHYRRILEDYDGWYLYTWGDTTSTASWAHSNPPDGYDSYGAFWVVEMRLGAEVLNYIIHKGDEKDPGPDQRLDILVQNREIYLIQGSSQQFVEADTADEALQALAVGDIYQKAQAHWLRRNIIAWPVQAGPQALYQLHFDSWANLRVTKDGIEGGQRVNLQWISERLPPDLAAQFPHLSHAAQLLLPEDILVSVLEILKTQAVVSATDPDGKVVAAALQIPGVLDDLYAEAARRTEFGIHWDGDVPTLRVWAPTARSVTLRLYNNPESGIEGAPYPMMFDSPSGTWWLTGTPDWKYQYYLYEVEVYVRQAGQFVRNLVTDPYSISLATNSSHSQIVNMSDPALKPAGWNELTKPSLDAFTDIVLYELHVRDFSARDSSVPPEHRGAYLAFTHLDSAGMRHLRRLAQAGLTHIHLLPVFDFATVNDDKSTWKQVDFASLAQLPPDSEEQQAAVQAIRDVDPYNWGYDPWHYTTPEGSYATDPLGIPRILEFRQMVQALNQAGLRVVMDVVYNHTIVAGQDSRSVLDRIVPGYYYRLDPDGYVNRSTCCANTASEYAMMEKLMLDSLRVWATEYKIDGFRFDLMGHHMVRNLQAVRELLDGLDTVNGKKIYLYGEGWDFGEVSGNARGKNASQFNLAGTGIGTFNDRLRDAVRGGTPFRSPQEQGFINGLYTDPNEVDNWTDEMRRIKLLEYADVIRLSLAGNLADYSSVSKDGYWLAGWQLGYNGRSCGYAKSPQETIQYISAHDNETLFDAIQYKAPISTDMNERVRMHNIGIDFVLLSQGIPFFDAGIELLRSKSLERDSFDAGDWFNYIDYTQSTNNWGVGLPLFNINAPRWPLMRVLLGDPALRPDPQHICSAANHFEEMLRIRKSSPLFRMNTAEEVMQRVRFYNTGPWQIPGVIVMGLWDVPLCDEDEHWKDIDPTCTLILVLFNTRKETVDFHWDELTDNLDFSLHPVQAASTDARLHLSRYAHKIFHVPGRTTAVFVGR